MPFDVSPSSNDRLHATTPRSGVGDGRTDAQRDRDRLIYSSAFRRLAEVTQVVSASSGYVFHNRLTHSLQVSQVGRRIAEKLAREAQTSAISVDNSQIPNPDVVEAAALAHDLGHPPFGHIIEQELNQLAQDVGGYEGNAQSFRILCKLAFHSSNYPGLNLTRASLAAVLKYPWFRHENDKHPNKWGAYESERDDFEFARQLHSNGFEQTSEAFLMDWADDITYSVHDLEDFYRAGRIPLHLLGTTDSREREYFKQNVLERHQGPNGSQDVVKRIDELQEKLRDLLINTFAPVQAYRGTERERSDLRNFTGTLIHRYVNAAKWTEKGSMLRPSVAREYRDEVRMLKELTWTYVIQDPALATQQMGQRHMVKTLFGAYADAATSQQQWKIFPAYYQERLKRASDSNERIRTCIDLIAGMTETQVHRIYARITGSSSEGSLSNPLN
jgi:dGTPase